MHCARRIGVCFTLAISTAAVGVLRLETRTEAAPGYPAPRFPKYLRTVTTIDPPMLPARLATRQIGGRTPMGLVKSGEHLLIVTPDQQDPLVLTAVTAALKERGVKVTSVKSYQMRGLTEQQARENEAVQSKALTARTAGRRWWESAWRDFFPPTSSRVEVDQEGGRGDREGDLQVPARGVSDA